MCSSTWAMPATSSVSSKYPAFTYVTTAATGADASRLASTVSPFASVVRWTVAGSSTGGPATGVLTVVMRAFGSGCQRTPAKHDDTEQETGQSVARDPGHIRER